MQTWQSLNGSFSLCLIDSILSLADLSILHTSKLYFLTTLQCSEIFSQKPSSSLSQAQLRLPRWWFCERFTIFIASMTFELSFRSTCESCCTAT